MKSAQAEGFSNIALIKYMGKTDASKNQASNPSLSYTLPHLKSVVRVTEIPATADEWKSLKGEGLFSIALSEKGREKFLSHVARLKKHWGYQGSFLVESANNFPSDCGIASSASSFAALTEAVAQLVAPKASALDKARLSRLGSGSSCRSFFTPWCLWNGDMIESVELPFQKLLHFVVLVDQNKKEVSSSEAHLRVATSPHFAGREQRVSARMERLLGALARKQWDEAFSVTWDEFEDMHQLFESSEPAFSYRTENSFSVLEDCKKVWSYKGDGPLVTMDAGANVHLLFREDQLNMFANMKKYFSDKYQVIASES